MNEIENGSNLDGRARNLRELNPVENRMSLRAHRFEKGKQFESHLPISTVPSRIVSTPFVHLVAFAIRPPKSQLFFWLSQTSKAVLSPHSGPVCRLPLPPPQPPSE